MCDGIRPSERLQTFSEVSLASPLITTSDNVHMSKCVNKAGDLPQDLQQASRCVNDISNEGLIDANETSV